MITQPNLPTQPIPSQPEPTQTKFNPSQSKPTTQSNSARLLFLFATHSSRLLHNQVLLHTHSFATLSPFATFKPLLHYQAFAPHSCFYYTHIQADATIQSFSTCTLKLPPHTQVFATQSSLCYTFKSSATHLSCCYMFDFCYTQAFAIHFQAFAAHSSFCYTHSSLCYTLAFATHSSLLLHIHLLLHMHNVLLLAHTFTTRLHAAHL